MKKFLITILFFATGLIAAPQLTEDKARLEKERQALRKEISEIQGVYNKVKGQKKETLGQLNLLQKKLALQDKYIRNINKEIHLLNDDIYLSNLEINKLQRQLDTLKAEYARSVVYAYKTRSTYDYLNFIFSASNFNDALKRIAYLKSYRSFRQQQFANISETQEAIRQRKGQLVSKKTQKNSALKNQTQQLGVLADQKKEKDQVISKLKSKESEYAKQISARRKKDAQLKNAIAAIIRREIAARKKAEAEERSRREAELAKTSPTTTTTKTAAKKTKAAIPLNEKEVALSSNFQSNKGRLPWPVDNGYVCIHYGTYTIPGTNLKDNNSGITICTTSPGATVKAVFDGQISSVFNLGDGMAVMIRHGKYYTVYSNLSGVNVSNGASVRTGQPIGRTGGDDEGGGGGKVDFLLMVETNNVNPEPWLRR
ncbi:MAG: murein hydrolase activator EnvC [Chitinophagaceae bacterium]